VISPQLEKYTKQVVKKHDLGFPVLRDPDNQVAGQFGLVFKLPEDLQRVYLGFGIDLERFNGETSWTLAMPGRFILDRAGTIVNVEVDPDYTKRPEPTDMIEIMKRL